MLRWLLLMIFGLSLPIGAAVTIVDLPGVADDQYDLTWEVTPTAAPVTPLLIAVTAEHGQGYRLRIDGQRARWETLGGNGTTLANVSLSLPLKHLAQFTLKRRSETMALLLDHRLLFTAPAPGIGAENVAFESAPVALGVKNARYQRISRHIFADNFMRQLQSLQPDGSLQPLDTSKWIEDPSWPVAFFRRDNPAAHPVDPATGKALTLNPWSLGYMTMKQNANGRTEEIPTVKTSTNGFWFNYSGVGPSWAVASELMVQSFWDRYYFQAAVLTEYDSVVGLIAAYQDNNNYLLFRWAHRDYAGSIDKPRAEIIAIIDGKEHVLASSPRGFDPEQWYTLRLNVSWGRVEALVDGEVLLSATNPGTVEGRVGFYADGVAHPSKPEVDDETAKMYLVVDKTTKQQYNDAADAMNSAGNIRFNDVKVDDWVGIDNLTTCASYATEKTGHWQTNAANITSTSASTLLTGDKQWSHYQITTQMRLPANGSAGLYIHQDAQQSGYLWKISAMSQALIPLVKGIPGPAVDSATVKIAPSAWADLRVESDGPSVTCYCNGQRVLETYDLAHVSGRCGLYASDAGAQFTSFSVTPWQATLQTVKIHSGFDADGWMATWSGNESDWYPVVNHGQYLRLPSSRGDASDPGPAGPLMTNVPGLYWNKGGYYHDLRVTIPLDKATLDGQSLYLSTNYDEKTGYRLTLTSKDGQGAAALFRNGELVKIYPFAMSKTIDKEKTVTLLVFQRRGNILVLTADYVDPGDTFDDPTPFGSDQLFAYRDPKPLACEMIGFNVIDDTLPAAHLIVASDRIQDAFEESPANWMAQSGIWAVMARFTCQPQWNWYGGFGAGTPTLWNKTRLDGDQTVEVYMGIKMQYDNETQNETQRFRDLNATICADGVHVNSGYTVIRAGMLNGARTTMLLRKGTVVAKSILYADQIPSTAHRQWFAIRLEKRGAKIQVFIDNHLSMSYVDPDPLPGGYTAFWTLNNGIMIGRANLSAEKMTLGSPTAAAPLAVQEDIPTRQAQPVMIGGQPASLDTFEDGLDGWKPLAGMSSALIRKQRIDDNGQQNTYLKIINVYPAGDLSAIMRATPITLSATPVFTCDYCFDEGAQVNLYLQYLGVWYEFLLTGQEAAENVHTVSRIGATADNTWRHLQVDLGQLLTDKITKETGSAPTDLKIDQVVLADWSISADLRRYGFGANPGGTAIRFDNVGFMPRLLAMAH
jgi:hypothetical protein